MKKIIAMLIASAVLLSVFALPSFAATGAALSASNASGAAGETVDVTISITDNPGLIALRFSVEYDATKVRLSGATDAGLFGANKAFFGNDINANPYVLMWEDGIAAFDYTANGTIATLSFEILATAPSGDTSIEITLDQGSTFNCDMDDVSFDTFDGIITIVGEQTDDPEHSTPTIAVGETVACQADTIEVPIEVQNNPGIVALSVEISYDSERLTLIKVTDRGLIGNGTSIFGNNLKAIPYKLAWEDGLSQANHSENGILAVLTFKVKAAGDTEISLAFDASSTFNIELNSVAFDMVGKTVNANKISISAATASVFVGDDLQLVAHYAQNDAVAQSLVWASSNTQIAAVDENGLVTGKAVGNVTITATTDDGLYSATYILQIKPTNATVSIINYSGSYDIQLKWWKRYSSATMTLGYNAYNCENAARYVWSSSSTKVRIDQNGNITNTGSFSRSSTITLTAYDAENNVIAKSTVTVSFYKFSWQQSKLQSQSVVSDNILQQNLSEKELLLREAKQQNPELTFITDFVNYLFDFFKMTLLH